MRLFLAVALAVPLACRPATSVVARPIPALPFAADSMRAKLVRPGVTHWFIYAPPPTGPWAVHALSVDLDACYSAVAVKGAAGAIGREKTSALIASLGPEVVGGVNADFFLFAPPGVPTGAHLSRGRVVTGPSNMPVLAIDSAGTPTIVTLRVNGSATIGARRFEVAGWNHREANGLAMFDAAWAANTDTASSTIEVVVGADARVVLVDTTAAGVAIPTGGAVLVAGGTAGTAERDAIRGLSTGDSVQLAVSLAPMHPREAVGGRPLLVRDSLIVATVDAAGAFSLSRHPRTAVGIARGGKRLLLVVVDGRQKPYSDGMTLRELATLMLALGARDALNLDGGGSTTLVVADAASNGLRIANRPSDATGERAVGSALAVVRGCSR